VIGAVLDPILCEPELPPLPFEIDLSPKAHRSWGPLVGDVEDPDPDTAATLIVRGHLEVSGPVTAAALADRIGLPPSMVAAAVGHLEADGAVLRGRFSAASRGGGAGEEVCDRRMLARIHRLTLGRLRREIEPVSAATLMRFFARWQRVGGDSKLIGIDGLLRAIEQLQGFAAAAGAWERDLLPARLHAYEPSWLDTLCLSGQVSWARLQPRAASNGRAAPTRAAPMALMLRQDAPWLRASAAEPLDPETDLGPAALAVWRRLASRGASFIADLIADTDLAAPEIAEALWELAGGGLATADGFASLRCLVDRPVGDTRSRFDSRPAPPRRGRWQRAIKQARRRDAERPGMGGRSLAVAAGRWSLLPPPDPEAASPEAWARQLLCRYGVVFRDLLLREPALPPWRDILRALRRLEARGEIRGGRFVTGFVGEQFALPEALEGLRALRRPPAEPEVFTLSATDPLNLVGITSAGPKVPAVIGNQILFRDGVPIASIEAGKLVLRAELTRGETVTEDLEYRAPSRVAVESFQPRLL
jgi:ATP-dependent Lhr-like helicase